MAQPGAPAGLRRDAGPEAVGVGAAHADPGDLDHRLVRSRRGALARLDHHACGLPEQGPHALGRSPGWALGHVVLLTASGRRPRRPGQGRQRGPSEAGGGPAGAASSPCGPGRDRSAGQPRREHRGGQGRAGAPRAQGRGGRRGDHGGPARRQPSGQRPDRLTTGAQPQPAGACLSPPGGRRGARRPDRPRPPGGRPPGAHRSRLRRGPPRPAPGRRRSPARRRRTGPPAR